MVKIFYWLLFLVDNVKENDFVIMVEIIRGREELRNKIVFNKNGKFFVLLLRFCELCLLFVDSMFLNRMYYSYRLV